MFPVNDQLATSIATGMIAEFGKFLANPEVKAHLMNFLFPIEPPKDHIDVAKTALEAFRNGHLTREQAKQIILICLLDDAKDKGKVIDIQAKRVEIESLFNS